MIQLTEWVARDVTVDGVEWVARDDTVDGVGR